LTKDLKPIARSEVLESRDIAKITREIYGGMYDLQKHIALFFVIMLAVCNGPAEDTGDDPDEKAAGAPTEVVKSR